MRIFKRATAFFAIPVAIAIVAFVIYLLVYLYNKLPIICNDYTTLEDLLKFNFVDVEIVDLQSNINTHSGYTEIVIYVKADMEQMDDEFFERSNFSDKYDKNFELINAKDRKLLAGNAIDNDIYQYGCAYGDLRKGMSEISYPIYWYEIKTEHAENANLLFSTIIPRRIYFHQFWKD